MQDFFTAQQKHFFIHVQDLVDTSIKLKIYMHE